MYGATFCALQGLLPGNSDKPFVAHYSYRMLVYGGLANKVNKRFYGR
jgi:hypothetical protein